MRKFFVLLLLVSTLTLTAKPLPPAEKWSWHFYYTANLPDGLFDQGKNPIRNQILTLPDKQQVHGVKFNYPAGGMINLYDIISPRPKVLERTILTAEVQSSAAGKNIIGVGVDWKFKLYCNGKLVYDTTRFGNGAIPTSNDDHYVELELRAGANELVFEVFGGSQRFDVAVAPKDIPSLDICYKPWVVFPDSNDNCVSIVFSLTRPAPAGVDYRLKGSEQWRRVYNNLGGQIRRDLAVHHIRLDNLQPDSEYEYRAVMIDETRQFKEIPLAVQTFKTAPAVNSEKPFSVLFTSDIQFRPPQRKEALQQLFNNQESRQSDFFAFVGDVDWTSNFDRSIIEEFVNYYLDAAGRSKPLVMVRGNHELYGRDTNRYFTYFPAPESGREGYFMFRYGQVCFIVLDFGDDEPRRPAPSTRCLHDLDVYLAQQSKWLEKALASNDFQSAKFRIVLAHATPLGYGQGYMPENVRRMIDPLLGSDDPRYRIHLWIGGHIHRPFRSIPLQESCYSPLSRSGKPLQFKHPAIGKNYAFTVVTMSGPNGGIPTNLQLTNLLLKVNKDQLEIIHRDREHNSFDHFSITPDGKVKDIQRADWFRRRDYTAF